MSLIKILAAKSSRVTSKTEYKDLLKRSFAHNHTSADFHSAIRHNHPCNSISLSLGFLELRSVRGALAEWGVFFAPGLLEEIMANVRQGWCFHIRTCPL